MPISMEELVEMYKKVKSDDVTQRERFVFECELAIRCATIEETIAKLEEMLKDT